MFSLRSTLMSPTSRGSFTKPESRRQPILFGAHGMDRGHLPQCSIDSLYGVPRQRLRDSSSPISFLSGSSPRPIQASFSWSQGSYRDNGRFCLDISRKSTRYSPQSCRGQPLLSSLFPWFSYTCPHMSVLSLSMTGWSALPFPPMHSGIGNKPTFCAGCQLPISRREHRFTCCFSSRGFPFIDGTDRLRGTETTPNSISFATVRGLRSAANQFFAWDL
jgi:hypothetical protein